jgi:hypothetical protein
MRPLRFSPSMLVGLLSLFVATSGGAFAAGQALIPGSSIKPHSIPLSALTPAAIAALRGQEGPQGPAGPQGPPGGSDPSKVFLVTGQPAEVAPGTISGASVSCPSGSIALGGGGTTGGGKLVSQQPLVTSPGSSQPVGWVATADNDTSIPVTVEATAICMY